MIASRFADTNGDGSGTKNAVGNYSGAPQKFCIAPEAGEIFKVERIIPFLKDSGSLDSDYYGNGIILTNGIQIKVVRFAGQPQETVLADITDGVPVKSNSDWKRLCFDQNISEYGTGNETAVWRYTFSKDAPAIVLDGDNKEEIQVILNDDFSGLVEHYFRFGFDKIK